MQQRLFPKKVEDHGAISSNTALASLNQAQLEAATSMGSPILVIAGAGTGKTRTLVHRMAHLVSQGIMAENILLLTFTRKAAQEMIERAGNLIDSSAQSITGGTFHAVANVLLRRYGRYLDYSPNFTILDRSDSEGIINLIKTSLKMKNTGKRFPTRRVICNILSRAVNKNQAIESVIDEQYGHFSEFLDDLKRIAGHYHLFKREHNLMDYDDLLVNLQEVLSRFPEVRREVSRRFQHILVDEYQDTNQLQAEIVRLTADGHPNIMVVGDDSQSIYSFRGADFRNIMDFPRNYPGTKVIRLEENYRSTQAILSLTNEIIAQASEKYDKKLFSNISGGEKPVVNGCLDESAQARWVCEQIGRLTTQDVPLTEIAVLFRSGFHSYKVEMELNNRHITFEKRGGIKLTESAHIKDVLSYLRVVNNPADHLSWNRLLLMLNKVGPKTAQKILATIQKTDDPLAALKDYPAGRSWQPMFKELLELLEQISAPGLSPVEIFDLVMTFYQPTFERIYPDDYPTRSRDLDQMRTLVAGYSELQGLIDDTALDPPESTDETLGGRSGEPGERLVLSTIHSAKGLEWDHVFLINMTAGRFPSSKAYMQDEYEEERRMFYVAATRARKSLFLVYPREAAAYGRPSEVGGISPFLTELPHHLLKTGITPGITQPTALNPPAPSTGRPRPGLDDFRPGMLVKHQFFGIGEVEKKAGGRSIEVNFKRHGRKILHLDYARLEIMK